MQLEGDGEGYKTILMDPIAIDEPLLWSILTNSKLR